MNPAHPGQEEPLRQSTSLLFWAAVALFHATLLKGWLEFPKRTMAWGEFPAATEGRQLETADQPSSLLWTTSLRSGHPEEVTEQAAPMTRKVFFMGHTRTSNEKKHGPPFLCPSGKHDLATALVGILLLCWWRRQLEGLSLGLCCGDEPTSLCQGISESILPAAK